MRKKLISIFVVILSLLLICVPVSADESSNILYFNALGYEEVTSSSSSDSSYSGEVVDSTTLLSIYTLLKTMSIFIVFIVLILFIVWLFRG